VVLPEPIAAVWGKRLYGCDLCQDPCPFNTSPRPDNPPVTGELGPSISIRLLLSWGLTGEIKQKLRGTALGMGWMNYYTFIRNALQSAGTGGDKTLVEYVKAYTVHEDSVLAETSRRVLDRFLHP